MDPKVKNAPKKVIFGPEYRDQVPYRVMGQKKKWKSQQGMGRRGVTIERVGRREGVTLNRGFRYLVEQGGGQRKGTVLTIGGKNSIQGKEGDQGDFVFIKYFRAKS